MSEVSFWASFLLWRDAVLVSVLAAAALSFLGVWVVLKRVVYVPLALSQVASAGVVTSFFLHGLLLKVVGDHETAELFCDPVWYAFGFSFLAAVWFARPRGDSNLSVVSAYLLSGAAVLILGNFVRQDMADLQSILFGSAVLVESSQIVTVGSAALVVFTLQALFYPRFLFVSFDPDSAGAVGLGRFRTEVLLYGSFALMISLATRAIGALPAFGLTVLPGLAGLRLGRSMAQAFAIAMAIGVGSAALGYYLSFIWELPTGACMVGLAGLAYLVSSLRRS